MKILKEQLEIDKDFYNPKNINLHLEMIKDLEKSNNYYNIHYYWRVPREFGYKQLIAIKSAIVSQNLKKTKIILWSNIDLTNNVFFKEIAPFVETKVFNFNEELKKINLNININFYNDHTCYLESDLFRILVIANYGGIYCDMDTILLKDMSYLCDYEFTYHWGETGFDGNDFWQNNAFLSFKQNSDFCLSILDNLKKVSYFPNTCCYGRDLFALVRQSFKDYYIFPCAWFGAEWAGAEQKYNNPFKFEKDIKIYDNFAWHWHNKWDEKIEVDSKFFKYASMVEEKFKNL